MQSNSDVEKTQTFEKAKLNAIAILQSEQRRLDLIYSGGQRSNYLIEFSQAFERLQQMQTLAEIMQLFKQLQENGNHPILAEGNFNDEAELINFLQIKSPKVSDDYGPMPPPRSVDMEKKSNLDRSDIKADIALAMKGSLPIESVAKIDYTAAKPAMTGFEVAKAILYWTFPPTLLWGAMKWAVNRLAGEALSKLVLPAQAMRDDTMLAELNYKTIRECRSDLITAANQQNLELNQLKVKTHDGAILDTVELINPALKGKPPSEQNYIVAFTGNGVCYELNASDMLEDCKEVGCNVVGFNFRGVVNSEGKPKSKDDLVTDGIAQIQRLIDKGVPPERIRLKAHSLGAGVASLVAKHFHDHGQPIILFNGRSFSNITNFIVAHLRGLGDGYSETTTGKLIGYLAYPLIKLTLALTKWEIEAASAYKALPKDHRDYVVVRSDKEGRQYKAIDDTVIPHYASLHEALKSERTDELAQIEKAIKAIKKLAEKEDRLLSKSDNARLAELEQQAQRIKFHKVEVSNYGQGHNLPLAELKSRDNKNAKEYFQAFFKRTASLADEKHKPDSSQRILGQLPKVSVAKQEASDKSAKPIKPSKVEISEQLGNILGKPASKPGLADLMTNMEMAYVVAREILGDNHSALDPLRELYLKQGVIRDILKRQVADNKITKNYGEKLLPEVQACRDAMKDVLMTAGNDVMPKISALAEQGKAGLTQEGLIHDSARIALKEKMAAVQKEASPTNLKALANQLAVVHGHLKPVAQVDSEKSASARPSF